MTTNSVKLDSIDEARSRLGDMPRSTFYQFVKDNGIPLVPMGKRSAVLSEDIDRIIKERVERARLALEAAHESE